MKKHAIFTLISFFAINLYAIEKESIKSQITEVTVFTQGAQVFRKANYSIKPGLTDIIIDGICPTIDPRSLQVKATGNIVIIDSKYSTFYPKPEIKKENELSSKTKNEIKRLKDSIDILNYELMEIQDEIDVITASKNILSNNGAIKGQGKVNDSIQLLKQALEYYNSKMNELNKKLQTLKRKKSIKTELVNYLNDKLQQLQNYNTSTNNQSIEHAPIHRITISVSTKELVSGKITLSYLVSSAGWNPSYDLKTEILTGKVNLTYKANVFQYTGTNWDDVKLTVSTNNPNANKTKPTLHPWYLSYQNTYLNSSTGQNYVHAAPALKRADKITSDSKAITNDEAEAKTSSNYVQFVDQIISAEYKIDLPYSISSNNEPHLILIKNEDLTANFKYYAVPKLDPSVYLIAQISKIDELQLVPANANIYFDGSFLGTTYLNPSTMEDTLNLSLGKDPNILIKRTLVKKDSKEKLIGNQNEKIRAFEIDVKNQKNTNIELVIQDQIPISQTSDIVIELLEKDKANFNESNGMLEWKLNLKSKESNKLKFSYKVKYNKEFNLIL